MNLNYRNVTSASLTSHPKRGAPPSQYYLTDHLGSARVMMKGVPGQTYTVSQYYNLSPWGATIDSWGSYNTPYKFTSKEHDQHGYFKAHYFGARYYDDRLGMFTSVDPAGQFVSAYSYGGNDPILGTDPDGRFFTAAAGSILGSSTWVSIATFFGFSLAGVAAYRTITNPGMDFAEILDALMIQGAGLAIGHFIGNSNLLGYQKVGIQLGTGYVISSDKTHYWSGALVSAGVSTGASYIGASLHGQTGQWNKSFFGESKSRNGAGPLYWRFSDPPPKIGVFLSGFHRDYSATSVKQPGTYFALIYWKARLFSQNSTPGHLSLYGYNGDLSIPAWMSEVYASHHPGVSKTDNLEWLLESGLKSVASGKFTSVWAELSQYRSMYGNDAHPTIYNITDLVQNKAAMFWAMRSYMSNDVGNYNGLFCNCGDIVQYLLEIGGYTPLFVHSPFEFPTLWDLGARMSGLKPDNSRWGF